jgi:2'-5' RNA ligase
MNNVSLNAPVCEYYILIKPSHAVKEEVKSLKLDFLKEHGAYIGQNSNAHIGLVSFFQNESKEETLVYSVEEALKECQEFDLFLNGFGFSPADNSFFVDVLDKQPLIHLHHQLRTNLFKQLSSLRFMQGGFLPQMNIGCATSSMQYMQAVKTYEGKMYTNNFRVFQLTILKRKAPFRTWEKLTEVSLGDLVNQEW